MLRKIVFPLMLVFAPVATALAQDQKDTIISHQNYLNQPPDTLYAAFPQDSLLFIGSRKPFYFSHGDDRYTVRPVLAQILKEDLPNSNGAYLEYEHIEVYDLYDGNDEYRGSIPFDLTFMDSEGLQEMIVAIFKEQLDSLEVNGDSYYLLPQYDRH